MQSEPETIKNEEDFQVLAANRYRLLVFIADHTTPLYGTIRSYVARLGLAILEDFDREALASRLGTTNGAARMRLHRALDHLRLAWKEQQEKLREGENNA